MIDQRVEATDITRQDDRRRNAPEITLRVAQEQLCTRALDPRQREGAVGTAAGYAAMLRLHVPHRIDIPITAIKRQMINKKIKAMANKPMTASWLLRAQSAIYSTQLAYRDDGDEHEPTPHLERLVDCVIVEDPMHVAQREKRPVVPAQECPKLPGAVARHALADGRA